MRPNYQFEKRRKELEKKKKKAEKELNKSSANPDEQPPAEPVAPTESK